MLAGRKRLGFIGEALCWQARRTGVCHKSSITGSQRRDIGKRLGQVDVGISRLVPHELARRDRRRRLARLRRGFARGREAVGRGPLSTTTVGRGAGSSDGTSGTANHGSGVIALPAARARLR